MSEPSDIRTHLRSCAFCEAACGIQVRADHATRRILDVRGDKDDPFSQGFICAKAYALTELHSDPDRLRKPLRRKGRDFEEIGWQEAIDEAADRLLAVQKKHGRDAVAFYLGNPSGHKAAFIFYGAALMGALGTRQIYSPGTLDQFPKWASATLMFGGPLIQGIPDLDRTAHLIVMGANPLVSQGSMICAPAIGRRIKAIRERGGRVTVIDPRRTETAEVADDYLPIRPGADAYLLFAMLHVLFEENLVRLGRAQGLSKGLEQLRELAQAFPPERVATATGIAPETIRELTRAFATAPSAAIHGRTGTCTQRFGTVSSWLIDVLCVLTGNLDRAGGLMFTAGGVPQHVLFNQVFEGEIPPMGRWHSRVRGLPEFAGMLPTAALADEILTPGEGQVRALVTQAGNVALSNPNGAHLAQAFESLEFMLSLDIYVNETTRHADLIIPGPSYAEHSDFAVVTPYEMLRKYTKWAAPIFEPPPGMPRDWEIFGGLAARLQGVSLADMEEGYLRAMIEKALAEGRAECRQVDYATARAAVGDEPGEDRLFDVMVRAGRYGDAFGAVPDGLNLARLREHPHGLDLGPLTEELPGVLATPDRLIDLAPPLLVKDVSRLEAAIGDYGKPDSLLMIGRRHIRSKNAWMHNIGLLNKGKDACTLLVHPDDAAARGLADGDRALLRTHIAEIEVPVQLSDEMMPGVVSLPHGWGHGMPETRQRVANARPGVNANWIIDELVLDVPSATTVLNGVPVELLALAS